MDKDVDIVVIGAGPVGLACAIEARRAGLTVRVVDKGALCNSLVGYPLRLEFFSTPELMEIGGHAFPSLGDKPTREEALEYYGRVAALEGLDLCLYERVVGLEGEDGAFVVRTERGAHRCRKVVAATGFFDVPNRLDVPGGDLPKVQHYWREPYPFVGRDVLVVGAKNSAAKAALALLRHGARVTMAIRGDGPSQRIKYWIRPDLVNRIEEGSIRALTRTTVARITEDAVELATPDGPVTLPNDDVLALTGYRPDYGFLTGVLGVGDRGDPARTPAHDDGTFETDRQGVYLAGTVCGGLDTSRWFIENGRFHAARIAAHVARGEVGEGDLSRGDWRTAE